MEGLCKTCVNLQNLRYDLAGIEIKKNMCLVSNFELIGNVSECSKFSETNIFTRIGNWFINTFNI